MLRWIVLPACLVFGIISARAAVTNRVQLQEQLGRTLSAVDVPGAVWGAQVASLRNGRAWFETNVATRLVPASNTKLFTAALALDRLGPEKRLMTSLRIAAPPDASGRLAGALRVVGGGDPSISARLHGGSWEQAWAPLVEAVKRAGIRHVEGGLICDERRFTGVPYGSGWNWDDLADGYGAAVSALTAGDNVTSVVVTPGTRVGEMASVRLEPRAPVMTVKPWVVTAQKGTAESLTLFRLPGDAQLSLRGQVPLGGNAVHLEVSVPSPALRFGMLFRDALVAAGVTVSGPLRVVGAGSSDEAQEVREIASVPSPPIRDLVREMMKPSQNLHAQLLLLAVGAEAMAARPDGGAFGPALTSEAAGLAELPALLRAAGIAPRDVELEEGSGLSRKNLVTPRSLVQLLTHMNRHPAAALWRAALPIGGVDGTLRSRFTQPGLKGNVRAKTGTLRNIQALSGYLTNAVGEPLVFSILVNGTVAPESGPNARQAMDAWVTALAQSAVRAE